MRSGPLHLPSGWSNSFNESEGRPVGVIINVAGRNDPRYRRWGEGTVLGWAQSRMLRQELPELRPREWIGATAAGAAAAWATGMSPSTVGDQLQELWPPLLIGLGVLAGVVLLGSIGFAQWLVLRRHVARAGGWVAANALAWVAGLVVVFAAIGAAPGDSPILIAAFGVAGGLGMGLTVALITGLFLVRLLDRAKPASHR
jgi:hypothetical protein